MKLRSWWPAVLWAGAIFVASSLPGAAPGRAGLDKLGHVAAYAVLALLVARALGRGSFRDVGFATAWRTVLLTTLYGVTDEWHQSFVPTRTADPLDVVADAVGSLAGVSVAWAWSYILQARRGHVLREPDPVPRRSSGAHHDQPPGRPERAQRPHD